jgi:hypothetical protein
MRNQRTLTRLRATVHHSNREDALPGSRVSRTSCLAQLLLAYCDIAERDDIHEAARRLELVQQWIQDEAERAAHDPIFSELLSV